jgi:outer membrane protein assembly factor BamB
MNNPTPSLLSKIHVLFSSLLLISITLACKKGSNDAIPIVAQDSSQTVLIDNNSGNGLFALNAKNGTVKWNAKELSGFSYDGVIADQQTVYEGDYGGNLYAFSQEEGTVKWTYKVPDSYSNLCRPELVNGLIYVGSANKNIYILNSADGTLKSTIPTVAGIQFTLAVADNIVYAGTRDYDNKFYAFDVNTGQQKWSAPIKKTVFSKPVVANGIVYVGDQTGILYALDAATGQQKWSANLKYEFNSSPVVIDTIIYVGGADGTVYAFDTSTGQQKWATKIDTGISFSSPVIVNGILYIGGNNNVFALDAKTGQKKLSFNTPGTYSTPTIVNETIYIGAGDGYLYVMDVNTGALKWKYYTQATFGYSNSVVITKSGKVYRGFGDIHP